jgi:hypothetical protein
MDMLSRRSEDVARRGNAVRAVVVVVVVCVYYDDAGLVRWSLDIRYCDATLPTGRPSVPGFLARSALRPSSVARSHIDWLALFEEEVVEQEEQGGGGVAGDAKARL